MIEMGHTDRLMHSDLRAWNGVPRPKSERVGRNQLHWRERIQRGPCHRGVYPTSHSRIAGLQFESSVAGYETIDRRAAETIATRWPSRDWMSHYHWVVAQKTDSAPAKEGW